MELRRLFSARCKVNPVSLGASKNCLTIASIAVRIRKTGNSLVSSKCRVYGPRLVI